MNRYIRNTHKTTESFRRRPDHAASTGAGGILAGAF
jgi:hypothetical protein